MAVFTVRLSSKTRNVPLEWARLFERIDLGIKRQEDNSVLKWLLLLKYFRAIKK
jgi:hypothetical protein